VPSGIPEAKISSFINKPLSRFVLVGSVFKETLWIFQALKVKKKGRMDSIRVSMQSKAMLILSGFFAIVIPC
jgi:hypothetical protein